MSWGARSSASLKVRQPLSRLIVKLSSGAEERSIAVISSQIIEEVNTKNIEVADDITELLNRGSPSVSEGGLTALLDTEISPELKAEGMAREIVHRIQNMRRAAGFDIADYIATYYQGEEYMRQVMVEFADYIRQETLSRELIDGASPEGVYTESYKLSGYEISLGVKRL